MRFSYDKETDSLYIHFSETPGFDAEEVAPGVVIDFDEAGLMVGMDIEHASKLINLSKLEFESFPLTA